LAEDSNKKSEKQPENSSNSINEEVKGGKTKSDESEGQSGIVSDLKKLATLDSADESSKTQKADEIRVDKDQSPPKSSKKKEMKTEEHTFHFPELAGNKFLNSIKSRKDIIIRYSAAVVGVILIIYGLVLISASVTKVADNVIFGEGASFAAFSILLGVLIIVGAFSRSIINRSFLKNINNELEIAEGKSDSDDGKKKFEEVNGNKDNKKGKDNNDNIVGENKK
jgi:hypothetical protein